MKKTHVCITCGSPCCNKQCSVCFGSHRWVGKKHKVKARVDMV